ncbi:hypothetical protein C8J56DRAFT_886604 [Mycena floridula]|nr:hypothetical protein C8J56DRAFT_886604 [Mycena floridula]
MTAVPERTYVIALLTFSISLAANILPADLVRVGTVAFSIAALIAGYIHYQLPHMTLLVLQSLLRELDSSVKLLADTDHGLWFRASLQSLKHNASSSLSKLSPERLELANDTSKCEEKYLALSSVPWPSYFLALLGLIRVITTLKTEARYLLTAVKSRLEVERQADYRAHNLLNTTNLAVTSYSPMTFMKIRPLRQSVQDATMDIV